MTGSSSFDRAAGPRVPVAGEVWVFRHLPRHRGRVLILECPSAQLVRYRYFNTGTVNPEPTGATWFARAYEFEFESIDEVPAGEWPAWSISDAEAVGS